MLERDIRFSSDSFRFTIRQLLSFPLASGNFLPFCKPFPGLFPLLRKSHSVSMNLFQIMDYAEQVPLGIDLLFAPQSESIQAES